ncbi:MAG: LysM peptidoglycan-binding domain-containing protein [Elusimicrobia bacterium]|nr:LysM peptidoglycan-binding domain-containing protein [Elusimicrobiota bacterium]
MKRILIILIALTVGIDLCFSKEELKVYTVVKGDTLSKIAQRFYNDRDEWKKIYSYNKYIKNSHWIFPGDTLIIPIEVTDEIEEAGGETEAEEEIIEEFEPPVSTQEKKKTDEIEEDTIIADENWVYDGYVSGEKNALTFIGQGNTVFLDVGKKQDVKSHDRFTVYRKDRVIYHPETGKKIGTLMRKIGVVEVTTDIQQETCTGRVLMSREPIVVGDMIKKQPKVKSN